MAAAAREDKLCWLLLQLGFDPAQVVAQQPRFVFDRELFHKPNSKAFEHITHFLLSQLDPEAAYKHFRCCWPIVNKKDEQEFRKICCTWLRKLSEESSDPGFPKVQGSLLLAPGGPRFISLMYHFAKHVLWRRMRKLDPSLSPNEAFPRPVCSLYLDAAARSLMVRVALSHRRRAHIVSSLRQQLQQFWSYMRSESKACRDITDDTQRLAGEISAVLPEKLENIGAEEYLTSSFEENRRIVDEVRQLRVAVDEAQIHLADTQSILQKLRSDGSCVLDGTKRGLTVPRMLLQHCRKEMLQCGVNSVVVSGELNLVAYLKLIRVALGFERQAISQVPPVQLEPLGRSLEAHSTLLKHRLVALQAHHSHLLDKDIPHLQDSVRCLLANRKAPTMPPGLANLSSRLDAVLFSIPPGPAKLPQEEGTQKLRECAEVKNMLLSKAADLLMLDSTLERTGSMPDHSSGFISYGGPERACAKLDDESLSFNWLVKSERQVEDLKGLVGREDLCQAWGNQVSQVLDEPSINATNVLNDIVTACAFEEEASENATSSDIASPSDESNSLSNQIADFVTGSSIAVDNPKVLLYPWDSSVHSLVKQTHKFALTPSLQVFEEQQSRCKEVESRKNKDDIETSKTTMGKATDIEELLFKGDLLSPFGGPPVAFSAEQPAARDLLSLQDNDVLTTPRHVHTLSENLISFSNSRKSSIMRVEDFERLGGLDRLSFGFDDRIICRTSSIAGDDTVRGKTSCDFESDQILPLHWHQSPQCRSEYDGHPATWQGILSETLPSLPDDFTSSLSCTDDDYDNDGHKVTTETSWTT
uniref:HAUS augmin-like complex subunit 6 N-terminal domain-containing protein n=1 Tax=Eptatretus burgeri TaxID=7764 RepID=A0A8C4QZ86_EPTBU